MPRVCERDALVATKIWGALGEEGRSQFERSSGSSAARVDIEQGTTRRVARASRGLEAERDAGGWICSARRTTVRARSTISSR